MESLDNQESAPTSTIDDRLFDLYFPKHIESRFAAAIFELGLKHSSPKIIMVRFNTDSSFRYVLVFVFSTFLHFSFALQPLMPEDTNLSTEHIKSHLQKYRIHKQRSKEEFLAFYNEHIKDSFQEWEATKGWKSSSHDQSNDTDTALQTTNVEFNCGDSYLHSGQNCEGVNGMDGRYYPEPSTVSPVTYVTTDSSKDDQQTNSKYIKDMLQETETLLQSIHGLCQEVIENGDVLKRKPEIQRCSVNSN